MGTTEPIPIEVTARFDREGVVIPQSFTLEGRQQRVDGVGRRWKAEDGEHILVMLQPGDRVLELVYQAEAGRWWLIERRTWQRGFV